MGFYYQTVFYNNKNKQIVLANDCPIIDDDDIKRGYVLKEQLLSYYGHLVKNDDITDNSKIVEYVMTTLDGTMSTSETRSLAVK